MTKTGLDKGLKVGLLIALLTTFTASCGSDSPKRDAGIDARDAGDARADVTSTDTQRDTTPDTTPTDVNATDLPTTTDVNVDVPADVNAPDAAPDVAVDVAADVPGPDVQGPDVQGPDVQGPDVQPDVQPGTHTIGGTISGLTGTGLVLRNNGGDNRTVAANATTFTFATALAPGAAYAVTVLTQPTSPTQVCTVANGTGTVAAVNITNVAITCTTTPFTVGGTISGLTGTSAGLVLRNVPGTAAPVDVTVAAGATTTFTFPAQPSGTTYNVTVQTQPNNPSELCTVNNGTGTVTTANVTTVTVTCSMAFYSVGGTVTGLTAAGLTLTNNGGNTLTVTANAGNPVPFMFTTQVASGATYAVAVATQPAGQTCTVTANGSGPIGAANVTNVAVTCVTNTPHSVGGTIVGLAATSTGLILRNTPSVGAVANINVAAGATTTFTFPAQAQNSMYAITVVGQPSTPTQNCTVTANPTGTVTTADISTVVVTCTTTSFAVTGTVTGYTGTGLVLRNTVSGGGGPFDVPVSPPPASQAFTFPQQPSGTTYAVTVQTQPGTPTQNCTVTSGAASGTIGAANVVLTVTCVTTAPVNVTVGGTVTGLTGAGLMLENTISGGTGPFDVSVDPPPASQAFTFPQQLSGTTYAVTVLAQPTGQLCTPSAATGTANANVNTVVITCIAITCDSQTEPNPTASTVDLLCPDGQVITGILFANFGHPTGTCLARDFAIDPACPEIMHDTAPDGATIETSLEVVTRLCVHGVRACTIPVETMTSGPFQDPCAGVKRLSVLATCGVAP